MTDQLYYQQRVAAEAERVRLATSPQAKAVHQQLQNLYSARIAVSAGPAR